ncbi:MAG: 16S rRNA (cytidine(1402)-2'-O)-methyltransferase [Gammaproteobacteria bacterium]|nr:16S rRNA (cytidine(1402)-2'-O)-methyltransferase [Gammaproteobacteria bacterium]
MVATPIGNLKDISLRALEILASVDLVAAEDTRHTRRLLDHFEIKQKLIAFHDHNERRQTDLLVDRIKAGESVALVSDAGTPLISDPGFRLVRAARAADVVVEAVPGASALTAALSVSGLPTDQFQFLGFLPAKGRATRLAEVSQYPGTIILYEAPHRMASLLETVLEVLGGDRELVICRELTKLYEQVVQGLAGEVRDQMIRGEIPARGEFVVLISGATIVQSVAQIELDDCLRLLIAELPISKAAELAGKMLGLKRNLVYKRALALKAEAG